MFLEAQNERDDIVQHFSDDEDGFSGDYLYIEGSERTHINPYEYYHTSVRENNTVNLTSYFEHKNPQVEILREGLEKTVLRIRNISQLYAGKFQCRATNRAGTSFSTPLQLDVVGKFSYIMHFVYE